jgi:hypothetical protein
LLRENPSLSFSEIARTMSEQYRQLSNEEKERLDALVLEDKERYTRDVEEAKLNSVNNETAAGDGYDDGDGLKSPSGADGRASTDLNIPVVRPTVLTWQCT